MQVCKKCDKEEGCNKGAINNLLLLPIKKIAAWQLLFSNDTDLQKNYRRVMLPPLQRGAVWKPKQVEFLWDSLMRGFPAGSFLLAPFDQTLGVKKLQFDNKDASIGNYEHHFHLLDGQQRANAIALGFLDPWDNNPYEDKCPPAILWIDLAPDPNKIPSREFGFRIVTRSHPWGYRLNNPEEKLGAAIYRDAIESYKYANKNKTGLVFKSGQLALTNVWPWDAVAPVPFCFLIESVSKAKKVNGEIDPNDVIEELTKSLENLPFWENWNEWKNDKISVDKQKAVKLAIEKIPPNFIKSIEKVLDANIPALVMKIDEVEERKESNDTIEELFIRVNAGGTKLEGEELIYSILKSVMPEVHEMVEKLATKIMPPSRLVSLAIRVYEARIQRDSKKNEKPPAIPSVSSFRTLIKGERDSLKRFMLNGEIKELLNRAKNILNYNDEQVDSIDQNDPIDFGLPPVIVTDIARNSAAFFFYLLVWLDIHKNIEPDKQALIGVLTTLHWFGVDKERCLRKLWPHLDDNPIVWTSHVLRELVPIDQNDQDRRLLLLPMPPKKLRSSINKKLESIDEKLWKLNRWEFRTKLAEDKNSELMLWIKEQKFFLSEDKEEEGIKLLFDRLVEQRGLLLYAQRKYIVRKFSDYDPSNLDQQDDVTRPWDYDHIHPHFYIYYVSAPQLIKSFHSTNGNYRAWPMEENRSDQKICPKCKLGGEDDAIRIDDRKNSFIDQDSWDNYWEKSVPTTHRKCVSNSNSNSNSDSDSIPKDYLANSEKYSEEQECLLLAILGRTVYIYEAWYDTLKIGTLFSKPNTKTIEGR